MSYPDFSLMSSEQFHSAYPLARMRYGELVELKKAIWLQLSQADEKILGLTAQTSISNVWLAAMQQANAVASQLLCYYAAVDAQQIKNSNRRMRLIH